MASRGYGADMKVAGSPRDTRRPGQLNAPRDEAALGTVCPTRHRGAASMNAWSASAVSHAVTKRNGTGTSVLRSRIVPPAGRCVKHAAEAQLVWHRGPPR